MRVATAILGLAIAAAGCGGQPIGGQPTQPPDLTLPTLPPELTLAPELTVPPELTLPPDMANVPAELFQQVADEAAAIAGVAPTDLLVVRAEAVTWNDGSLGCPEPDQMYTQALVDGYWIVLRGGDREFDFRASQFGEVRLCPPGQGGPPLDDL